MRYISSIILCTALATFMGRLDTNIVAIALPAIADNFHVSAGAVANLMLYYLLTISVLLIPLGSLGDRIGFRTLLLAGYATFTAGSLACGLSGSIGLLTAARSLQGAGAAMMIISAYSIIPRQLAMNKVGSTMGMLGTAGSVGVLVGAPLGGVLTEWLSWRSIFLVNLPVGAAALWLAWRHIPHDRPKAAEAADRRPFDWPGCLLGACSILLIILGLDSLRDRGDWLVHVTLLSSGLLLLALFVFRLRTAKNPLFDPAIFANKAYRRGLGAQGVMFMCIAAHGFALPFYLDRTLGLSHQNAGLVMALFPLGVSVAAPLAGRLADRFSPQSVLIAGTGGNAAATALFCLALHLGAAWSIYLYLPFLGLFFGAFLAPSAKLLLAEMKQASQGATTSLFNTINNISLTFGVAMSALILTMSRSDSHQTHLAPEVFFPLYAVLAGCGLIAALLTARNLVEWLRQSRQPR